MASLETVTVRMVEMLSKFRPRYFLMSDSVSIVKFRSPDNYSEISDSLLPVISANFFCEIPFNFKVSAILTATSIRSLVRRSLSSSMLFMILVRLAEGFLLAVIFPIQ